MLIQIPVTADTSVAARKAAVGMALAMGYKKARALTVMNAVTPDVDDAFVMNIGIRSFIVQVEVNQGPM